MLALVFLQYWLIFPPLSLTLGHGKMIKLINLRNVCYCHHRQHHVRVQAAHPGRDPRPGVHARGGHHMDWVCAIGTITIAKRRLRVQPPILDEILTGGVHAREGHHGPSPPGVRHGLEPGC